MPIFEYRCDDCGAQFEKLVRHSQQQEVACPTCGHDHVTTQYSTFAARSGGSKTAEVSCAPEGGCGAGACGGGMCGGMNFN